MAADAVGSTIVVGIVAGVSSLLGAAIGAAVSLRTNSRNIKIENITKERAKWRDNVRKKALKVHQAAVEKNATRLQELYLEFTLILNPAGPGRPFHTGFDSAAKKQQRGIQTDRARGANRSTLEA